MIPDSGDRSEGGDVAILTPPNSAHGMQESPAHDFDSRLFVPGWNINLIGGFNNFTFSFIKGFEFISNGGFNANSDLFFLGGNPDVSDLPPQSNSFVDSVPSGLLIRDFDGSNPNMQLIPDPRQEGSFDCGSFSDSPINIRNPPSVSCRWKYLMDAGHYFNVSLGNPFILTSGMANIITRFQLVSEDLTQTVDVVLLLNAFGFQLNELNSVILFGRATRFYPQLVVSIAFINPASPNNANVRFALEGAATFSAGSFQPL